MAKIDDKSGSKVNGSATGRNVEPTIFARMMDLQCELRDAAGMQPLPGWEKPGNTPVWVKIICIRYRQTILKSVMKLKPGRRVNWRNYGRCIGLMERYKTFIGKDVPNILKKEGLLKLSKEKQAKLKAASGEKEMRQYYLKLLNRRPTDRTSLAKLVEMALSRQLENLERHRQVAFYHLTQQDAKTTAIFWKGVSEGYSIFINEEGEFSGDDRRTGIYSELLSSQYEVEKMRRVLPAKSRVDLRAELKKSPTFQDRGQCWFNDVCDEIKLSMRGSGRPHSFSTS